MNVIILPNVMDYLEEQVENMYNYEYFNYIETAERYIINILLYIQNNLHKNVVISKKAPDYYNKYSKNLFYYKIKVNKHTQWYVFFETVEKNNEIYYIVVRVENNHTASKHFNFNY